MKLKERNIKVLAFSPCPPGASSLGGMVESLVKQVKHVVNAAISKRLLCYDYFYFVIRECMIASK